MSKGRKRSPSQLRYESKMPTASSRVTREVYNRLQEAKAKAHMRYADILEIGLAVVEGKLVDADVAWVHKAGRQGGYDEGYKKGFDEAEERYRVQYICDICGFEMFVETEEERMAASEYMMDNEWRHAACQEWVEQQQD